MYLDPPYVTKSKGLYMNSYDEKDHRKIAKVLTKKCDFFWILSYDKDPLIEKLYRSRKKIVACNMSYGTSNKRGSELIYFHPRLKIKGSVGNNDLKYNLM